jgi:hypothetical protein
MSERRYTCAHILTLALDTGELPASCPGRFTPVEIAASSLCRRENRVPLTGI